MRLNLFISSFVLITSVAMAAGDVKPVSSPVPTEKAGPCSAVMAACRAAGYRQGGHKDGKGIHADCVGKLFRGEPVAGVSVTPEQIKACQDRHGQIESRMQHGKLPAAANHLAAPVESPKK